MGEVDYLSRPKRRKFPDLSNLGVVSYRALERREFGDVNAIHRFFISLSETLQNVIGSHSSSNSESFRSKIRTGLNTGKHLFAGAFSAAVCKTVVAPFERVRMDILLGNTQHGAFDTCIAILKTEGVLGFWRGNLLNIIRTAPFKAVNFYSYDVYSKALWNLTGRQESGDWERFTAGALAGVTALLSCLPLDTIRTRLLSSNHLHQYKGLADCFGQIVEKEGVTALYKGCLPGLLSIAPSSAVFYGVYGTLKQAHLRRQYTPSTSSEGLELPIMSSLLYGAIAGVCAEAVVYPLEVIRRQIQLQTTIGAMTVSSNGIQASSKSLLKACTTIIETQGFGGFYAGVLLNTVQVLPSAALSYFTYEAMKSVLKVNQSVSTKE
eukprot:g1971.t1